MTELKEFRTEAALQVNVVKMLREPGFLKPGVVWFAVPNGEHRSMAVAKRLKAQGVRAGVADLIFLHGGRALALELKRGKDGRLSEAQKDFAAAWMASGGDFAVARAIGDVVNVLANWGALAAVPSEPSTPGQS